MAFLLSPKTGGGAVSYALVTGSVTSINGAAAQEYTPEAPGTVKPGDVLTWDDTSIDKAAYFLVGADEPIKDGPATSPYTVEVVAGAELLSLYSSNDG